MHRKKILRFALGALIIGLVFGTVSSIRSTGVLAATEAQTAPDSPVLEPSVSQPYQNPSVSQPAEARPAAPAAHSAYLPLLAGRYPMKTTFGIEMHDISTSGGLDQVTQAGTSWVRRNALLWSDVEPVEGVYNWSALASLEQEMLNASRSGTELILVVRSTPSWAQAYDGVYCGPVKADKLAAFGNFLYEAVRRYSVPPFNVKYWQIWNEPDVDHRYVLANSVYGCWGDSGDPYYGGGYYGDMLSVVNPRIKAANPQAQVMVGGLLMACPKEFQTCSFQGSLFLEGILRRNGNNDGKNYFDGVGFHSYDDYKGQLGQYANAGWHSFWDESGPVLIAKAEYLKAVLARYNASDKFLMNTEAALRCGSTPSYNACKNADQGFEETKAYYMAQLYAASIAEGLRATVWYDVMGGWLKTGLLNYPDLTPYQAYYAFQVARNSLLDASFKREIGEFPGVKGYEFELGNRRIWVLWSFDGSTHSISLPGTPKSAWDALNNPVSVTGTSLTVDLKPLYLEWRP